MPAVQSICVIEAHSSNNTSPPSTLTVSGSKPVQSWFPLENCRSKSSQYNTLCVVSVCTHVHFSSVHVWQRAPTALIHNHMQILPFDGYLSARVHTVQALTAVL